MIRSGGDARQRIWLLVLLPALLLVIHAHHFNYVVDDAFISYRYARNLVEGHGLVFNPGERVEGYTNFLWVILAAAAIRLGLDPLLTTRILGVAAALAVLVLCFRRSIRSGFSSCLSALTAPFLLAANSAFALWSQAGLETSLFSLLVLAGVLEHSGSIDRDDRERKAGGGAPQGAPPRWRFAWSVWLGLATLTRPEGGLFFALCLGVSVLRRSWRTVRLSLPVYALIVVPFLLWRFSYYGQWLPNTYYAKTEESLVLVPRGLVYLWGGVKAFGLIPFLCPLLLLWRGGERKHITLAVASLGYIFYMIWVGGDGLAMYRFFVPLLPLVYCLTADALAGVANSLASGGRRMILAAGAILILGALNLMPSLGGEARDFVEEDRMRVNGHWTNIGKWLASYARPGESVAVTTAGAIPYYSGLRAIDMLGITDPHIAHHRMPRMGKGIAGHERFDMDYILDRRPTYILHYEFILNRPVVDVSQFDTPWNPGLRELPRSPRFNELYEPRTVQIGPAHYVSFFALRPEYHP